jgi:hypothetical protein
MEAHHQTELQLLLLVAAAVAFIVVTFRRRL